MGTKKYTAKDIAHYIVNKCIDDHEPISNLQLQKILYLVQEHYIGTNKTPLFDDNFVAWKYGPVIESVYREFSSNGGEKITQRCSEVELDCEVEKDILPTIKENRSAYPWELVKKLHQKGHAWDTTFNNGEGYGDVIPLSLIEKDVS